MKSARVILSYGPGGASITSSTFVEADPPISRFQPSERHVGAWLEIKDSSGRTVYATPLPDPRLGGEAIQEDGTLSREIHPGEAERTLAVEVPFPGEGASIAIHVADEVPEDVRAFRVTKVAALNFSPEVPVRAFDPDLVEHSGWGADNQKAATLLFLPDGFTEAEMPSFRAAVEKVKAQIAETSPFSQMLHCLRAAHAEIASNESGIQQNARDTRFRGHFTIARVIEIDQSESARALDHYMAGRSAVALVVANTTEYGGSGGTATVFSLDPDWMSEIAIHELGHSWFKLADEYTAGGQAATMEPVEVNVCGRADRAHLKWVVADDVPLPTLDDNPTGVVGAFEGAKYREKGIFRPAFDCKMRTPGQPFCPVCSGEIRAELARHLP